MHAPLALFRESTVATEADYRLPRNVVPGHYRISMEPDLVAHTFRGTVEVEVEIREQTTEVVLNALHLDIRRADMVQRGSGRRVTGAASYDRDAERATITLDEAVDPGDWELHLDFDGVLNDKLLGFYRSTYTDANGVERTIATTQLESTFARRAFPCWDEPDLKATFGVTLVVPDGHMAISNNPVESEEDLGDGRRRVRFAETMKMSTYLLAFIVGELEATDPADVDGVPLRIVHIPGKGHLTAFALEAGAHALRYYSEYYDIPYPGEKVDMIAIPDFGWGAMENLGAITYRESDLLVDPDHATQAEVERVTKVINHEMAHMWFGDLVTMRWWTGIWLNEAFATFMEVKANDHFRPEWRSWLHFGSDRTKAMEVDALSTTRPVEFAVASPEEANAMFDFLTYEKGGSVLRMLEQYLGEETFRAGISRYLKKHAYGNTVTDDLWDALEEASGEPVRHIMRPWIFQGGFPHIHVAPSADGYRIAQEQFRYLGVGNGTWPVPLLYRDGAGTSRVLVEDPVEIPGTAPFIVNAGGHGFYRTRYPHELLEKLSLELTDLDAGERFALLQDTWASALAAEAGVGDVLELVSALRDEPVPFVWTAILGPLTELHHVAAPDDRPGVEAFVRDLVTPVVERLGWHPEPGESDRVRQWRGSLLRTLGITGADAATIATSREVLERSRQDPGTVDGDVASAALAIVAGNGAMADFEDFVNHFKDATNPQEANRYRRALASVPDDEAAGTALQMVLDGTVRRHDSPLTLALMLAQRVTGDATWYGMQENWDEVVGAMKGASMRRVLDLIYFRSAPEVAADIENWLTLHPLPGCGPQTAQQLELLEVRVGLRRRAAEDLGPALRKESRVESREPR
jgi:puromycin-sensitive aminopeptidase